MDVHATREGCTTFIVIFWLGTHMPNWLNTVEVPLMVSYPRLRQRAKRELPRARAAWVLDSGGYSELSRPPYAWQTTAQQYVADVRRYADEVGSLQWAAVQDYMCEPWVLEKTGLDIAEHQYRSVVSYLDLRLRLPEVTWCPVLQGWETDDYLRHRDMFEQAGVVLASLPVVGVGSVCRRQGVRGAIDTLVRLTLDGLQLHGFGLKTTALASLAPHLASADSMAWSYAARKRGYRCPDGTVCNNHLHWALEWRQEVLDACD